MRSRLGLQVRSDRATCSGLIKHWRAGARVRGSDESNKVSTNDIQAAVINESPAIKNSSQTTSQYFGINIRMFLMLTGATYRGMGDCSRQLLTDLDLS